MNIRETRVKSSPEAKNNPRKVVIIGGGLSGTAAGLALKREGHDVTIVEACEGPEKMVPKFYLIDWVAAKNLEMTWQWVERPRITGFSVYAARKTKPICLQEIDPSWARNRPEAGFAVLDQEEIITGLWDRFKASGGRLLRGEKATGVENESGLRVKLAGGNDIEADFVINAAGLGPPCGDNEEMGRGIDPKARIRALYGFLLKGRFPPRLIFLTGLSDLPGFGNERRALGAWLMPKGDGEAMFVINEEIGFGERRVWYKDSHKLWLLAAEAISRIDGITISERANNRPLASGYRVSPAGWKETASRFRDRVVSVGEIDGQNASPTGELIDRIFNYADLLAKAISSGDGANEAFQRAWRGKEGLRRIAGRAYGAARLEFFKKTGFSNDPFSYAMLQGMEGEALWKMLRGGCPVSPSLTAAVLANPECWPFVLKIAGHAGRILAEKIRD